MRDPAYHRLSARQIPRVARALRGACRRRYAKIDDRRLQNPAYRSDRIFCKHGAVANTEKVLATAPSLFIGAKKAQKNKSDRKTLKKYNRAQGEESSDIIQRKKVVQNTMFFHAIAEFMNIKGKGKKEKLHFDVLLTAEKESSEGKILF